MWFNLQGIYENRLLVMITWKSMHFEEEKLSYRNSNNNLLCKFSSCEYFQQE